MARTLDDYQPDDSWRGAYEHASYEGNIVPVDFRGVSELADAWPDPLAIKPSLLAVPAFEVAFLPLQLRGWCVDIAERMSLPLDMIGIPALVQAGALIGRRIGIRPETRTDWLEVGNLWGCVVANPGALKTPAMAEVLKPLKRLELGAFETNKAVAADYAAKLALTKIMTDEQSKTARVALKKGAENEALSALSGISTPERPPEKRYLVNDCTVEKLGEICADNPDGVLVHRDEVMALFGDLEQTEKQSARGFFLSGWGGQESYTYDRIMRGTIRIQAVNLSLIGTTQPDRLKRFISDNLTTMNDGMVQRLQLLAWPDALSSWQSCDRLPDSNARDSAFNCYEGLTQFRLDMVGAERDAFDDGAGIPFLRFAPEASEVWFEYLIGLEAKLRDEDLSPALASHFAKYRGLVPRLALIQHLASNGTGPVSLDALSRALALAEYLEAHARRAYSAGNNGVADAALKLLSRIKRGHLTDGFTANLVKRPQWSGLTDGKLVDKAINLLGEHHCIRAVTIMTGGRPSTQYSVNPKVK